MEASGPCPECSSFASKASDAWLLFMGHDKARTDKMESPFVRYRTLARTKQAKLQAHLDGVDTQRLDTSEPVEPVLWVYPEVVHPAPKVSSLYSLYKRSVPIGFLSHFFEEQLKAVHNRKASCTKLAEPYLASSFKDKL